MSRLRDVLDRHVDSGPLPGAVALVAHGNDVEVVAVGSAAIGGPPMARDSIFRIASITKPIVAAAVMMLVDDGRLAPADPIARWLPELSAPTVVRTPAGPADDVVPATRPITVADLLTFTCGWGFPSDFTYPAVQPLFTVLGQGPYPPDIPPDEWVARLAGIPLLHQPGEAWLYNTASDLQGVLVARVAGATLPDFLAERMFAPLGMVDTGFAVGPAARDRFTTSYRPEGDGLALADPPDGVYGTPPAFPSGAGGLVSTVDDWYAFARMLLAGGAAGGRRLLSEASVAAMTTDHLTAAQRDASRLFLEGQGWGYGGSVDVAAVDPWNVHGRYGWVGGTGTAAHLTPATGSVTILMTQVEMAGPTPPPVMRDFWTAATTS